MYGPLKSHETTDQSLGFAFSFFPRTQFENWEILAVIYLFFGGPPIVFKCFQCLFKKVIGGLNYLPPRYQHQVRHCGGPGGPGIVLQLFELHHQCGERLALRAPELGLAGGGIWRDPPGPCRSWLTPLGLRFSMAFSMWLLTLLLTYFCET